MLHQTTGFHHFQRNTGLALIAGSIARDIDADTRVQFLLNRIHDETRCGARPSVPRG